MTLDDYAKLIASEMFLRLSMTADEVSRQAIESYARGCLELAVLEDREKQVWGLSGSIEELLGRLALGMAGGNSLASMKPLVKATMDVVAAKEREACAKIAESGDTEYRRVYEGCDVPDAIREGIAEAIRKRGQP